MPNDLAYLRLRRQFLRAQRDTRRRDYCWCGFSLHTVHVAVAELRRCRWHGTRQAKGTR